jgi:hypothetical protein
MPRGRTAEQTKKGGPRGRHKKHNRELRLTAKDVLAMARELAGAGHPHDFIPADAAIATQKCGRGHRYVIRWHGVPTDHPGYGAEPGTSEARAAMESLTMRDLAEAGVDVTVSHPDENLGAPLREGYGCDAGA